MLQTKLPYHQFSYSTSPSPRILPCPAQMKTRGSTSMTLSAACAKEPHADGTMQVAILHTSYHFGQVCLYDHHLATEVYVIVHLFLHSTYLFGPFGRTIILQTGWYKYLIVTCRYLLFAISSPLYYQEQLEQAALLTFQYQRVPQEARHSTSPRASANDHATRGIAAHKQIYFLTLHPLRAAPIT
ncbi:hypothetical protein BDU57DRAFT_208703 [Ampelomyces quisqualis]|uniref:Uncharacterized protein n=1 Tax=Ampelomyces quisqualis TaxID=50730 RepID=A0A6A5QK66_AMPQU|nr:hypothetical protein BDU57DRAFT_208703 [Ampelomyces quisqualis]